MGNGSSLSVEDTNRIQIDTKLSVRYIHRIHNRFSRIDKTGKGVVTPTDFADLQEINKSPIGTQIATTLATKDKKQIDFPKFIKTLSNFHYDNTTEKYYFLFEIYDRDGDGFVGSEDLFGTFKSMVGKDLNDEQIREIVKKTIEEMDEDKVGKLSFPEFIKVLETSLPGTF